MSEIEASQVADSSKLLKSPSLKHESSLNSAEMSHEIPQNENHRSRRSTKSNLFIKFEEESEKKRHKKKSKAIHCTLCPKKKSFTSKVLFNRHMLKEHGSKKTDTIMCEICSAVLKSQAYFNRHMLTRHPKNPNVFICDHCEKSFSHKDYLRIHMDRHRIHQILTCNVCQKSYISKHTFRRHLKTHLEKHICMVCGLIFHQKQLLDNHFVSKHSDDLPYQCNFCTRLFPTKISRNNHQYIAHKNSSTELSFKCKECNIYFEMKEELRIHSFIHFNGDIKTCLECNQIFKTNRLLNIHMQKHEAKKSFQCTKCGDFFTFKTGLAKHIRLNRCKGASNFGDEKFKMNEEEIAEIAMVQLKEITKEKGRGKVGGDGAEEEFDGFSEDSEDEGGESDGIFGDEASGEIKIVENPEKNVNGRESAGKLGKSTEKSGESTKKPFETALKTEKSPDKSVKLTKMSSGSKKTGGRSNGISSRSNGISSRSNGISSRSNDVSSKSSKNTRSSAGLTSLSNEFSGESTKISKDSTEIAKDSIAINEISVETTEKPTKNPGKSIKIPRKSTKIADESTFNPIINPLPLNSKETRKYRKRKDDEQFTEIRPKMGRPHLIYICDYCGEHIKFKKIITQHMKQHLKRYKCKICVETFRSRKKLVDHSIETHGVKPQVVKEAFSCEVCDRKFDAKSTYEAHKLSHDDTARPHSCSVCLAGFKSVGNLRRHEATHAPSRNFHCDSCSKSFKTNLALKIHKEAVHAMMKVFVNCPECKAIVQEKHLSQHMKNMHSEDSQDKPFECSVCGKTFKTLQLGQRHYEAVHEPKNRGVVYTCPHCPDLQFFRQRDLKDHSFIHFDGLIYQCESCSKMFKTKRLLMIHRASHNEDVGFPCKICDNVVFKTRGGRRKHMLRLHATETAESEDVPGEETPEIPGENKKQSYVLVNHQILRQ